MFKLRVSLFVVCLIAIGINGKAQSDINFTAITVKEGLSSNTVTAILKDSYGLIWLATTNGLSRFDGSNFIVYRHQPGNVNSLPTNEVLSLFEDSSGKLWVGTGSGGVCYYDRKLNNFVSFYGDGSWPDIGHISVRGYCQDDEGRIWVATYGDLRALDVQTGKTIRLPVISTTNIDPTTFVALTVFKDSKKQMWVGTNNGLFLYNKQKNAFKHFTHNEADASSLSNNIVKAITEDTEGNLWFGTYGGLDKWISDGRFIIFHSGIDGKHGISNDAVYAVKPDVNGKLWIGTEDGVNIYDPASASFHWFKPDPRNIFSLRSRSIRSILVDSRGIYWIGTFGGGVSKYDKGLALFNLKQSNPFDNFGLKSSIVTAFVEYAGGKLFVATDGAGLERFDQNTGLFTPMVIKSKLLNWAGKLTIMTLYLDRHHRLWMGTYQNGLFCVDPQTGSYRQFIANERPDGLCFNSITSINEDDKGAIWLGTLGEGVDIYDPVTDKFHRLSTKKNTDSKKKQQPFNNFISAITRAPNGDMWIGSAGSGIGVYKVRDRIFNHYTKNNSDLADDVVQSIFFARDGTLWVGTNQGICYFNPDTQKFISFNEKQGLSNGFVKQILEDDHGLLWLSTDRGISSFDRQKKIFRNFTSDNGVQQSAFITGSGIKTTKGEIYFGGQEGFNYFNPGALPDSPKPGRVFLTELKLGNVTVTPGEHSPIRDEIGICKQITLNYGQNFSISYVALDYTSPRQNQYAYKLVGFDKDWNFVHGTTIANYTNIDPGNYVFQVKAIGGNTSKNQSVTEVPIAVLPPFWRTIYAYIAYFLFAGASLFFVRRRGIQKLRTQFALEQKKIQVEQMIAEERREAGRLHELDLLKIRFLTDLSHEFRTPISLIAAPVEKLLARQLGHEVAEDLGMINRNIRRLLNLVNQLLDFRKMEENELKLNLAVGDVIAFITETTESFRDIATKKQISLNVENTRESWFVYFDQNKLERVIFNLLSNAFKFTPNGGTVSLQTDIEDNVEQSFLILTIADTGVGISQTELDKIFDRFYQTKQAGSILNQGTGIGLAITREFVELHGGVIKAECLPERGMKFSIELPLTLAAEVSPGTKKLPVKNSVEAVFPIIPEAIIPDADKTTTVLLVEDNDEFRRYLAEHLKQYYHIVEATNGKEGWQKTLSSHPNLVVSDISMPQMNGIDLSKKIKADKRTAHIPVILLTAMAGEDDQLTGLKSGANDYLTKPFNFQILNARIANLLDLNKNFKNTYSKQIHIVGQQIQTESADVKLLNTVMLFMEARLSDPNLSVEELSKHVGMSRGSLYYKIIELTGLSPIEYMRTVRLEKAAALLETSDYNIAQIAYTTGFGTPSYFSRMFKAKFGLLPSEYLISKRGAPNIKSIVEEVTT